MIALRAFLLLAWLVTVYLTVVAAAQLGVSGSFIWITDFAHPWRAMFLTDFTFYLLIVGLWILYREKSAAVGISCAVLATALGSIFTLAYLFVTTFRVDNDFDVLVLGERRADKDRR